MRYVCTVIHVLAGHCGLHVAQDMVLVCCKLGTDHGVMHRVAILIHENALIYDELSTSSTCEFLCYYAILAQCQVNLHAQVGLGS